MSLLRTRLDETGVLLADGATGTNFFKKGLESGEAPELWNIAEQDKVAWLHSSFIEAGADIVLTNSFGGTRHRLKLHNAQDKVFELNKAAAQIAVAEAKKASRSIIIGGSIGPTGELLKPLGELDFDGAVSAFKEQIKGLKAGGVDVVWIETMSAADEMRAAAKAAQECDMDYVITASFDTAGKTMMGLDPADMGETVATFGALPVAYGANCGVGASDLLAAVLSMIKAKPDAVIVAKANCGIPKFQGDKVVYSGTPDLMSDYVRLAINAGVRIIGGCCGTSPEHLAAMRASLDQHKKGAPPSLEELSTKLGAFVNSVSGGKNKPKDSKRNRRRRS